MTTSKYDFENKICSTHSRYLDLHNVMDTGQERGVSREASSLDEFQ